MTVPDKREDVTEYAEVARRAWDSLAGATRPPLDEEALAAAADLLDLDRWIPWSTISTALVLGGGGGWQAPLIASLGPAVTVVDVSSRQLELDREAAARFGLTIECVEADMVDLRALAGRSFDLVYQPISTCYLPDLGPLYAAIASVTRAGARYWAEHWSAGQIQLDEAVRWDGAAYRIVHPVGSGTPIQWQSAEPVDGEPVTCWHFAHSIRELFGALCAAGFVIERVSEPGAADPDARPGSPEHLAAYLPPFIRLLARRVGQ